MPLGSILVGFGATEVVFGRAEVLLRLLAARPRRPTVAPSIWTRDVYTSPAAVRRISHLFKIGESAAMKGGPVSQKTMRNYPKLSWKSTTCDASPALPIDLNRTAGGFATAPLAADLIPKFQ